MLNLCNFVIIPITMPNFFVRVIGYTGIIDPDILLREGGCTLKLVKLQRAMSPTNDLGGSLFPKMYTLFLNLTKHLDDTVDRGLGKHPCLDPPFHCCKHVDDCLHMS
jgi:hypothetical protein